MILCIGLLIFSFIQQPKECGIGLVISIIGVPVYYLLIANQDKHPEYLKKFMSKYTSSILLLRGLMTLSAYQIATQKSSANHRTA